MVIGRKLQKIVNKTKEERKRGLNKGENDRQ